VKRALLKKGLAATAAIGTVAGLAVTAGPAQAAPPPGTVIIASSGSDTTDDYMNSYMANPDPNGPGDNGRYNIRAKYGAGGQPTPTFVPGDADCAEDNTPTPGFDGITWGDGTTMGGSFTTKLAPNGSTAGRDALKAYVNGPAADKGCIDVARSSSTPRTVPSDNATFQYNAFGLEVLGWATTSLFAPASLTQLQLYDIFKCNIRDWSTVGGGPARIQRMNIQAGSGTGDFFRSTFLGSSSPSAIPSGVAPDASKGGPGNPTGICPDAPFMQENDGSDVPASAYGFAIMGYSAGQWIFQANNFDNPTLDKRRGARLGLLTALSDGNASRDSIQPISLNTTSGSPTVTSTTKRFTNVNIGATITGNNIPPNTRIVSVTDPFTATLSNNATATGTDTNVFITSLPAAGAFWFKTGLGSWIPNTPFTSPDPDLTRPRGPVTEDEVSLNNPGASYLGVRYVFNVTDTASPDYADANGLVGFVNVPSGAKSPICDGSEATAIRSKGFAPLSVTMGATVDPSRNLAGSTCRRFTP
jgi:ABC-type phosphate transport system substrate-binding protein